MKMAKLTATQHARNGHIALAELHSNQAAQHDDEASRLGTNDELGKLHKMIAQFHRATAACENTLLQQCDEMAKAQGDELTPLPGVRGVIVPRASELFEKVFGSPEEQPTSITAVPRSGQPPLNTGKVDVQFEHLVKVD
jgi:hypothetical protein